MPVLVYPPSPVELPPKFTSQSSSYKLRAILAIVAIFLFFILYLAFTGFIAYLAYYTIIWNIKSPLIKISAVVGSAMLFIFTVKFIFKLSTPKPHNRIKLNIGQHPHLQKFIFQICEETGAPRPRSVYVDPDVNAYVAYTNVWLSLLFPTKKDLTIGMALTDCLNLSEFKAVIAHEFGHFAQRSMKIGSYIHSANTIIHDMIYTRDSWDKILDKWRSLDLRLSFMAWILTPVIWIVREILGLFYKLLYIVHASLSREMEFNADKVAVSVAGSDAIVSALWKLDYGYTTWNETMNHAYLATQKGLYSQNLFAHNALALERKKTIVETTFKTLPTDPKGGKKFFNDLENAKVSMYASHPPNNLREDNAKSPYLACKTDLRSPWLLFGDKERLQADMTKLIYSLYLNTTPTSFVSQAEFEDFIAAETQGKELLEEYENTFEQRFLHIPEKEILRNSSTEEVPDKHSAVLALKNRLKTLMQPLREVDTLIHKVQQIASGTIQEKHLIYRGQKYTKNQLPIVYDILITEKEKLLHESFITWDNDLCNLHYTIAKQQGKENSLLALYMQHRQITALYKNLIDARKNIFIRLEALQTKGEEEVNRQELKAFSILIAGELKKVNTSLVKFEEVKFVALPNIDTRDELKNAIIAGGKLDFQKINFNDGDLDKIIQTLESAITHCQRVEQKSIAVILQFHKRLADAV